MYLVIDKTNPFRHDLLKNVIFDLFLLICVFLIILGGVFVLLNSVGIKIPIPKLKAAITRRFEGTKFFKHKLKRESKPNHLIGYYNHDYYNKDNYNQDFNHSNDNAHRNE